MASVVKVRKRVANDRAGFKGSILEYVATWQVEFDAPDFLLPQALYATDGTLTVPHAGSMTCPGPDGTTYTLYFKGSDGRREDGGTVAEVFVTWSSDPENEVSGETGGKRSIQVTTDGVAFDEPVTKDKDGKLILNSALDPFPNGVTKTRYDEKISVRWTADSIDTAAIAALRGKINNSPITMTVNGSTRTFAAKTLKLTNCSTSVTLSKGDTGFDCSLEMIHREDTWVRKIADQGFYAWPDGGDPYRILDDNQEPITQPVYLDGNGGVLDTSGNPDAVLLDFDIDDEGNLASLLTGIS